MRLQWQKGIANTIIMLEPRLSNRIVKLFKQQDFIAQVDYNIADQCLTVTFKPQLPSPKVE